MLVSLVVKNLAIIDKEEIEFCDGLNILSGETGAGKSIILGALGLAMGKKPGKGIVRDEEKEALAEAVFSVTPRQKALLGEMDIDTPEDQVILQRKITPQRTSSKINGENVPSKLMEEVSALLIDIYGQHEQQTLLSVKNHILLLDEYAKKDALPLKEKVEESYRELSALKKDLASSDMDESERLREMDILSHEINEIEAAALSPGEDALLKEEFIALSKSEKVSQAAREASALVGEEVTERLARAVRTLRTVEGANKEVPQFISALEDAESILRDTSSSLRNFEESLDSAPQRFLEVQNRLDEIDTLKRKYTRGDTIEEVFKTLEENKSRLERLKDNEAYVASLKEKISRGEESLLALCGELSVVRADYACRLSGLINEALMDLNFSGSGVEIRITRTDAPTSKGFDDVCIYISTNPGEPLKPLSEIASGGELSRIMLAIKTIFAESGEIDTLVFDEIDAGISGKTAARVAKRLVQLGKKSQVICITHLPQIAAGADHHFLIKKDLVEGSTISEIRPLSYDDHVREVARMLAGDTLTEAAIENARMLIAGGNKE